MPDPNAALLRDQAMVQQLGYLTYASPIGFYTGSPLAAILGNRNGAAYGAAGRVFFFVGGTRYVSGGPTDDSNSMFLVTAADTTISVSYTLYDPGSDAPVGQQIVRYHWTGTRITALDPIPTSDPNEPRSRR
jgi:LppP/LprE lipoprotein